MNKILRTYEPLEYGDPVRLSAGVNAQIGLEKILPDCAQGNVIRAARTKDDNVPIWQIEFDSEGVCMVRRWLWRDQFDPVGSLH
ncbi:hypothetical protein [Pandoraea fibrosis]|uniref:Uncharacterized protein n=1 Tax=Pandoraea fibrosis TaxID=1891094 RepID=A0A5E4XHK3_9BURK|nr:hypothetical protein [Pandoraea fibrosis]VVE35600.1 hypothetical protein PFI31113_03844 [Pandoraea fibrosis]